MIGYLTAALFALLLISIPVSVVLFALAIGIDAFFSPFPLIKALGRIVWSTTNNATLVAIPLFILLGEILVRSGVAQKTYAALDRWVSWLPGGLVHANIATSTLFSATSGSSVATAATVSTVAMPQAEKLGYDPRLFSGAIAAGGTLGILIPPSINLIVYGFLTQTSIPSLFLAGLVPGLGLAVLFMIITAIICLVNPKLGGEKRVYPLGQMMRGLINLLPILIMFTCIVGSIYAGWATPTEAAAVGVASAVLIAMAFGKLDLGVIAQSCLGTVKTTAMISLIIVGASFLNFALASAGFGNQLEAMIDGLNLTPLTTMLVVIALYILLGFFIETLSLMVLTIPIVVPLVVSLGYDPIWFGILMIVLVEMALITPPVGLNLFVVQGARSGGNIGEVMTGAMPYVLCMLVMVALLMLYPSLALYLPNSFAG